MKMVATTETVRIRSPAMGSERSVGACEAKGVVRADATWLVFGRGFDSDAGCKICTLWAGSSESTSRMLDNTGGCRK